MVKIDLERVGEPAAFEAKDEEGHIVRIDTSPAKGGKNYGVRPMQLLLMGLGGCSGIDVLSILKKQRQEVKSFRMHIEADREQGKDVNLWTDITLVFVFGGDIDRAKAERACALSIDKYCSVAETLRRAGSNFNWRLEIHP